MITLQDNIDYFSKLSKRALFKAYRDVIICRNDVAIAWNKGWKHYLGYNIRFFIFESDKELEAIEQVMASQGIDKDSIHNVQPIVTRLSYDQVKQSLATKEADRLAAEKQRVIDSFEAGKIYQSGDLKLIILDRYTTELLSTPITYCRIITPSHDGSSSGKTSFIDYSNNTECSLEDFYNLINK